MFRIKAILAWDFREEVDGEASIVIYVDKDSKAKPFLPDNIEGIPVQVVLTDLFIAR